MDLDYFHTNFFYVSRSTKLEKAFVVAVVVVAEDQSCHIMYKTFLDTLRKKSIIW